MGVEPLEDDVLIEKASSGDLEAYEDLVRRYQDLAFRTAILVTREATAAEDAVQEAFIRAYRALARFRRGYPFRPWLLKIVVNEARRRRSSNDRQARLAIQFTNSYSPEFGNSVERHVLSAEMRDSLSQAVARLPEQDQLVITYRFALDLSEAEMASALGCARGTVKSRLSRALGRLREALTGPEVEVLRLGLTFE